MKKQYKTYLLLAVVLLVWGMIGYKFVSAINPSVESDNSAVTAEKFVPKEIKEREQFAIVADYRDPFLGTMKTPASGRKKKVSKTVKKELPKKNISYTGFITDKASKQKIFFVTIDGQQQMMGLKDTFNEVKLVQGTNSYIKVSYNGISEKIILAQ
ncbi:hypothetical protein SAMN04488007_2087 [Maribacter aquivivus]|uniref:Uncharacterized protein n=1 Tax=Maribacter aquivivus TaxID=228958 RepID=A0A1M6PX24_9FLAO|nr:hypothetical protein [Maribacter aquivivus]SHK12457.1 hypothetical protein SAMN04488007_2087 [Maribacter aquivivus]